MESLTGQTAVVTGGANGVGRGIASVLAREGARVAIADIDRRGRGRRGGRADRGRAEALAVAVDVTDATSTRTMAATVREALGPVDILAANAGIYPPELGRDRRRAWDRVMDVNVKGALHAIQACMPSMLATRLRPDRPRPRRSRGRSPGQSGFRALRRVEGRDARLHALDRARGRDQRDHDQRRHAGQRRDARVRRTRARSTSAGWWPSIPMGELAEPEDVGWAVRFLASPRGAATSRVRR